MLVRVALLNQFVDAAQGSSNLTFELTSRAHSVVTDADESGCAR